jgi:hypothetical protein
MKKILVLGLAHLANGDITVAAEALRDGYCEQYNVLFVCQPERALYVQSLGFAAKGLNGATTSENKRLFLQIVQEWKPDMLLCADVYTLEYSKKWSGIDFQFLKSMSIPVGSMDQWARENAPEAVDTLLDISFNYKKGLITDCDFLLRPCPLNKPEVINNPKIRYCKLFSSLPPAPVTTRAQWCKELNILPGRKVIFIANSKWEYTFTAQHNRMKSLVNKWMPYMIHDYCAATSLPIQIIHVGPYAWSFETSSNVEYTYINNMRDKAFLYLDTIAHADLFLAASVVNTSLSYATFYQTPSVVLLNEKKLDFSMLEPIMDSMPEWYREMAQSVQRVGRYYMYPWGWYNFLTPLLAENIYMDTFIKAPLFEPKKTIHLIKKYLTDSTAIGSLKNRQQEYLSALQKLPPIDRFFDNI